MRVISLLPLIYLNALSAWVSAIIWWPCTTLHGRIPHHANDTFPAKRAAPIFDFAEWPLYSSPSCHHSSHKFQPAPTGRARMPKFAMRTSRYWLWFLKATGRQRTVGFRATACGYAWHTSFIMTNTVGRHVTSMRYQMTFSLGLTTAEASLSLHQRHRH